MSLIKLPFLEKKGENEYFLSLILRTEIVKAVIFEKIGTSIKYINDASESFTNTIEDTSAEEFLDTLDKAIGKAESVLPANIETHKTLFGLKEGWIEDNTIKKEYKDKLKKATDELSLDPIGFLIFSESILNLIHKEEGAPVTAVLVELGNKYVTVSLVRAGKILEVRSSEMHDSYPYTVDTILKHFETADVLPSRIIIFDSLGKDLIQEFTSFKWSKSLPFLHIPQIVSLPSDSDVKAVILGAATQMGTEMIFDGKKTLPEDIEVVEENPKEENESIKESGEENLNENKDGLDYVAKDTSMEFFGFVQGADITKSQIPNPIIKNDKPQEIIPNVVLEQQTEQLPEEEKIDLEQKENIGTLGVSTIGKAKDFLNHFLAYAKKTNPISTPFLNTVKGKKLIVLPIILILAFAILYLIIASSSKAKIIILLNPKPEEKTQQITFSPTSPTDLDNKILNVEIIPVDEIGSTTIDATGKKDVGTKAKGSVTIFNNDTDPVSLSSGTILTSSNDQKFTLDSSVKVASASGDIFSGTKPGTADANITAADIGTDYNLPSGTKFTVGQSNTVAAKNDNALSGGTKKGITVVSKNDLATLEENLPKSLSDKAKSDIKDKIKNGKTIIPTFANTDISKETFDKKVDDETDQISINATVSFNYIAYDNNDILLFAQKLFNDQNFLISKNNLKIDAKNIKVNKNNDISADLDVKANLLPKIDTKNLIKQIAGENVQKAKNELGNLENVSSVEISIFPNLPFISSSLPKNSNNITITAN